ncbi:hypothetical protein K0U83_15255 [bacterium]|nr:hypothetical protein [bacterium]
MGAIDCSITPHPVVAVIFPGAELLECSVSPSEITATFSTPQTPTDLGPLVRVELISE